MKTIILEVEDNKIDTIMTIIESLKSDLIKRVFIDEYSNKSKEEILNGLKEAVDEVNLIKSSQKTPNEDLITFLDKLDNES